MIYLSPRHVPALKNYSVMQRAHIVANATAAMPFERKAIANVLKVLLLIALFWSLLSVPGIVWKFIALFAVGLLYPLVLMPVSLSLAVPFIPEAIREYERSQAYSSHEPGSDQQGENSENNGGSDHS